MKKHIIQLLSLFTKDKQKTLLEQNFSFSQEYLKAIEMCKNAKNLADIGCGATPDKNAKYAFDLSIAPIFHRGSGLAIDVKEIEKNGTKFIEAPCENLPVKDKFFDVSITKHMIEHVDDPIKACKEIMRVSKEGIIICPSMFAEYIFTRPYHKWFVTYRGNTLIFIEKTNDFGLPFGQCPQNVVDDSSNPFDILLNYENWYNGNEKMPRLSNILRKYWFSHDKVIENVFIWKDSFNVIVIDKDGKIKTN